MAKYTDASCKLCRREGCKLFLKGERCVTGKCALDRRPTVPGQHGEASLRKKPTGYALQLREKQKVKRAYGLLETQFKKYYIEAKRQKGATGEVMLSLLERRLDNVVYRLGFGVSRTQARQIVNHRHITVNGKIVNIPSYSVKVGDVIGLKETSLEHKAVLAALESIHNRVEFISYNEAKKEATYVRVPQRSELNADINESLIVEYYSRV